MNKERTHDNSIEESYDPDILTDLHSSKTDYSSYSRSMDNTTKNATSKAAGTPKSTERIPAAIKFSDPDIKKKDDEFDYQGEL